MTEKSIQCGQLCMGKNQQKESAKIVKKCLTFGNCCANIRKLSARGQDKTKNFKKQEKVLDKMKLM